MFNQHETSILDFVPTCFHSLCRCNPVNTSESRRSSSKRKLDGMQDWLLMEEFPLNAPTLSHTDIVDALDSKCCEIIEDHATVLRKRWRLKTSNSLNDNQSGEYIRVLICSYYDTCNCNARMKLKFSVSRQVISLLWYTFGYSHAMPSELGTRFPTFESHESFQHFRLEQVSEYDSSTNSVQLTIALKEKIEELILQSPTMSPSHLYKEMQSSFPLYSDRYWVKAHKSICSYRQTLKKNLNESGPNSEKYQNDSFIHIKDWVISNTYDIVSARNDFNIYSLFVAAHELVPDLSPPPSDPILRKSWKPKHRIRIVLCSIAMALNFPILQLKPSLLRYFCVSADSTFKLAIFNLVKVSAITNFLPTFLLFIILFKILGPVSRYNERL